MEHLYKKTKPSQRQLQIGSTIHRVLIEEVQTNEILYSKFHLVSFTGVRMNSGLKQAIIYFTVSDINNLKSIADDLSRSSGYFRNLIAKNLNLRFIPNISFVYDKSLAEADLLQENLRRLQEPNY